MSGRDLRMFITNHRAEDAEKLVIRIKNGLGSQKYKPIDYEQLQAFVEAKRMACLNTDRKIQKILQAAKTNKENTIIKQHQQAWWQEHSKLLEAREKLELHLQNFLEVGSFENEFHFEMKKYGILLCRDQEVFKIATVDPILQLKRDLKQKQIEMQHYTLQKDGFNSSQILKEVEYVKEQQKTIIDKLEQERRTLEEEIKNIEFEKAKEIRHININHFLSMHHRKHSIWMHQNLKEIPPHLDDIPEVLHYLKCPYPGLKASVMQEFQNLNAKYKSQLEEINLQLKSADRNCGWNEEEHWTFQVIADLYSHEIQNRNMLYLDMMMRLLPHKSKQDMIDHWRLWDTFQYKRERWKILLQSWARDKKDLLTKTMMIFAEASIAHEAEMIQAYDRQKQQQICAELNKKVQQMRAQQEEMARLEAVIAAEKKEREIEQHKKEVEKEMCRRAINKEKIERCHAEKQCRRETLEQRYQQRLEELKSEIAKQAETDRERVKYRQELLQTRLQEKKAIILKKMQEEEEHQKYLDAYWQKFAVTAEADPVRMMSNTEASKARFGFVAQEEVLPQKPLYHLFTYTDKQIVSDPRIRIEHALREAGLHNTFYAREVLSSIPPARPPRRDMESTIFKD
ncbi:coiled-coil domain-containing protein 148-like isoform X2 [Hypanus sabinus]|uniref:coiled-coil domain-containing protein 148-like isoform X2 n=1 Tax=Hypanus sabinus TaxID=79690 RepID=UPI0028C389C5|nr:coiled-coil domain-containing protein 148-like isoform X2 [Hypanus sabinus]